MTSQPITKLQALVLFLFVVGAFALLAVRTERNDAAISDNTKIIKQNQIDDALTNCEQGRKTVRRFNTHNIELMRLEMKELRAELRADHPDGDIPIHRQRIKVFRGGIQPIPDCTKLK